MARHLPVRVGAALALEGAGDSSGSGLAACTLPGGGEAEAEADGVGVGVGWTLGLGSFGLGEPGLGLGVPRVSGVTVHVGFIDVLHDTLVSVSHGTGARSDEFVFHVLPSSVLQMSVWAPSRKP